MNKLDLITTVRKMPDNYSPGILIMVPRDVNGRDVKVMQQFSQGNGVGTFHIMVNGEKLDVSHLMARYGGTKDWEPIYEEIMEELLK